MVNGENFATALDGKPTLVGFFVVRFVESNDAASAGILAMDKIASERQLVTCALKGNSAAPTLRVEELELVESPEIDKIENGYCIYRM